MFVSRLRARACTKVRIPEGGGTRSRPSWRRPLRGPRDQYLVRGKPTCAGYSRSTAMYRKSVNIYSTVILCFSSGTAVNFVNQSYRSCWRTETHPQPCIEYVREKDQSIGVVVGALCHPAHRMGCSPAEGRPNDDRGREQAARMNRPCCGWNR